MKITRDENLKFVGINIHLQENSGDLIYANKNRTEWSYLYSVITDMYSIVWNREQIYGLRCSFYEM